MLYTGIISLSYFIFSAFDPRAAGRAARTVF